MSSGPAPQQPPRSLAGGALLAATARVGFVFGGALVTVLVARLLGPDDSGAFLVISSLLLTLITLSTLGLEIGAAWMVASRRWPLPSALASSALAALILGLIGAAIGMAIYALSSDTAFEGIDTSVALLAMAALPPALVVNIYAQLAIATERYEAALVMSGIQAVVYVAGVAVLAAALDLEGAAAGLFAGWVAGALVALAWGRRSARDWEGERGSIESARVRQALAFGIKLYAANAAAILIYRFDVFLLNAYSGAAEAGYYAVAIAATTALVVLPTALGNVLFPRLASLSDGEADEPRRREVQDQAIRHTVLIVIASSLLLALALPVLTEPVFGEEFGPAVVPGLILIPGAAALGLATTLLFGARGPGAARVRDVDRLHHDADRDRPLLRAHPLARGRGRGAGLGRRLYRQRRDGGDRAAAGLWERAARGSGGCCRVARSCATTRSSHARYDTACDGACSRAGSPPRSRCRPPAPRPPSPRAPPQRTERSRRRPPRNRTAASRRWPGPRRPRPCWTSRS